MHLKSLELQGFKSFTDRTQITFHQGVTAIVGPNGSGKSNVTDAIRWVLGEQSAKTLRGGKMEDVIFSGTNARRPLGFAEVTMVLDNGDGLLPLEYAEVAITRRLYRSGESQYLINQNPCRLKDIHALFMDTGLGRDGYSIIGQGRVDEILSTRSEDRRRVFEEASGIQKYKTRRDEAARKLEHTQNNLTRVNDILSEIEGQLRPLEKQAEQAKQYLSWYEELKGLEVALILQGIEQKGAQLEGHEENLQSVKHTAEEALRVGLELEERHRLLRERQEALAAELRALREEKEARSQARESGLQSIHELRRAMDEAAAERAVHEAGLREAEEACARLEEELADRARAAAQAQEETARAEALVREQNERLDEQAAALNLRLGEQQTLRERLGAQQRALLALRVEREQRVLDERNRAERVAQAEGELEGARAELAELEARQAEQQGRCAELQAAQTRASRARETQEAELTRRKAALSEAQNQYNEQAQQLDQLGYRLDTLRELQQNMEGYNEPVKQVTAYAKARSLFGRTVFGSVGSLIAVDGAYERAVEIALGAGIQNLVVADERVAGELIGYLKRERKGRATFLPLSRIRPKALEAGVLAQLEKARARGYIALASELVRCDEPLRPALDFLLGRTVVCRDLEAANALAEQFRQSLRIVTLEGELISPGGAMSGGQYKNQSSLLSRKRQIEELLSEYKALEKELPRSEQRIEKQAQALKLANLALETAAKEELLAKQAALLEEARLEEQHRRLEALGAAARTQEERLRALCEQGGEQQREEEALSAREASLEAELSELEAGIADCDAWGRAAAEEREGLRDRLLAAQGAYAACLNKQEAERAIDGRIRADLERQRERLAGHREGILSLERARLEQQQALEAAEARQARLSAAAGGADAELARVEEESARTQTESAELFDTLRRHNSSLTAAENEKNRLEHKCEQLRLQLDELRNRLWESYSLTFDNAASFRRESLESGPAGARVAELKQAIRALGPVNVNAVEDHRRMAERHAFLKRQEADIEEAKARLDQVIADLTALMRERFRENFQKINENFQLVFRELFGGGKAEISLEANQDLLEGEIEIKASPPGKKLQNMLLLSGGERSLAAIALLFAILKLRPTPFCVLDEIEAALDDSNIFRFTDYIRSYADKSQFILVTHRKGTMEAADSIYGVTMQELGVSRILSMKLAD